jgi:NADH-quinone oxidoreductase subunit J
LAAFVGVLIALEMALVLKTGFDVRDAKAMEPALANMDNTRALGKIVYTEYLYPLQVAAVLLLVAIIAAIALTPAQAQGQPLPESVGAGARQARRPRPPGQDGCSGREAGCFKPH